MNSKRLFWLALLTVTLTILVATLHVAKKHYNLLYTFNDNKATRLQLREPRIFKNNSYRTISNSSVTLTPESRRKTDTLEVPITEQSNKATRLQLREPRISRNNSYRTIRNSSVTLTPESRRKTDTLEVSITEQSTVRCPTLKPPVPPFPPDMPPPCESNERFYSSPFFCHTVKKPLLVIIILSTVGDFNQRQAFRKRWVRSTFHMKSDFIAAHPWAYTFVVGRPKGNANETAEVMKSVDIERCHYKDVLTVDVLDVYYNLTWKKMAALEYLVKSDLDFEVVMKTDDDVYLNVQLVLEWLPDALSEAYKKVNSSVRPFFAGFCPLSSSPLRNPASKWYLSPKDYPPTKFPPFCFGTAYFFSQDLVKAILKLSDLKKAFRLEDVHSGILVHDTGLVPANHVVDPGRIYNYEPGHCSGPRHQYPFAVMKNRGYSLDYYKEFMQSLCK